MKKAILFFMFTTAATAVLAGGPAVWSVNTRSEILRGNAKGVSIDETGVISPAPRLAELFRTEQPYIWSSAADGAGTIYLGTGGDGKIFRVDSAGKGSLFSDLAEMNVTALAIGRNRELFASTSPDGKVYRIDPSGRPEVYFDPKQKYIWSLAVLADGSLAVGTGENGRIYLAKNANAVPESSVLFDSSETHIISLIADSSGNLLAGTDPGGIVLRISPDGRAFGLLDSPLREVHEIRTAPDGSVYVLALGEAASTAKQPEAPAAAAAPETKAAADRPAQSAPEPSARSRYDLTGARSAVYRILPDGSHDLLWRSATVTAFSLYAHLSGRGVLIGSSDKGRIFNISNDGRETLVVQTEASQISSIISTGDRLFAAASNQGTLFELGPGVAAEGTYESTVLDAKSVAAWGRAWWLATGAVRIETRSGNTEDPDETWSSWTPLTSTGSDYRVASPRSRYLQWRAILDGRRTGTQLTEVNIAYLARNIAPEVLSIQVLPTNVGLLPNPPVQVDPNIELSGLDPAAFGIPSVAVPPRRVYLRGATSLQWTAEDRNGDKLVYDVMYRAADEREFRPLQSGLTQPFLTVDGQSLADGQYVFKIVARDLPSNPRGTDLSGERSTLTVDIDNTPPVVTVAAQPQAAAAVSRVTFAASERSSYITRAEYSVNAGEWQVVYADDGISDSREERYTIEIPAAAPGEYTVTLRVFDINGNSGNARAVFRR